MEKTQKTGVFFLEARKKLGYNQRQIAEEISKMFDFPISQSTIVGNEKGTVQNPHPLYRIFLERQNVNPEYLRTGSEPILLEIADRPAVPYREHFLLLVHCEKLEAELAENRSLLRQLDKVRTKIEETKKLPGARTKTHTPLARGASLGLLFN